MSLVFFKLVIYLHKINAIVQFDDWLVVFVETVVKFDVVNLFVFIDWLLEINLMFIVDSENIKM